MESSIQSDLQDRLRLRQLECESLRDIMNGSTEEIVSLGKRLRESRDVNNELNAELLPLRHQLDQVRKERDLLLQRNSSLEADVAAQRRELSSALLAHSDASLLAATELRSTKGDLALASSRASELADQLALQSERTDDALRALQIAEEAAVAEGARTEREIERCHHKAEEAQRQAQAAEAHVERARGELALAHEERDAALAKAEESAALAASSQEQATLAAAAEQQARETLHTIEAAPPALLTGVGSARPDEEVMLRPAELYAAFEGAQAQVASERGARRQAEM